MLGNRQITLSDPIGAAVDLETVVKPYLGITGAAQDTILTLYIGAATDQAEGYCQRFFLSRDVTEKMFSEQPSRHLVLSNGFLSEFILLEDGDGNEVDAADYTLDLQAGIVTLVDPGATFEGDYTATYTAGWLAEDMPAAIQLALCELVKQMSNTKSKDSDIVIMQSPDIGTVTSKGAIPGIASSNPGPLQDLPASVQRGLSKYKRRWA